MSGKGGVLAALGVVLVAACAVLASTGFKGRNTVVGIDLGTTYSVVGINEGGTVRIIQDADGDPLVPSMVSFLEGGGVAVGKRALERLEKDPAHTIYQAKRFIGRKFEDEAVGKEMAEHHFTATKNDTDVSGLWFNLGLRGHPPAVSPQTVGSHVLTALLDMTAEYLGHRQVRTAVIAVPAQFDQRQRQATAEAFKQAGLKVVHVLEEPTAAALAYGLHKKANVNHILVYDFGGGTLDVSLLFVADGSIEVMDSEGDDYLGGSDFDQCMAHILQHKLGERRLADAEGAAAAEVCGFPQPVCAAHTLYPLGEKAKRDLTDQQVAPVTCMAPKGRLRAATTSSQCTAWEPHTTEVTRDEFEQGCDYLFQRVLRPIDVMLERVGVAHEDIDEVVMVGGSTRMPRVREMIRTKLGAHKLNTHIDPDVTVAYGAATLAH